MNQEIKELEDNLEEILTDYYEELVAIQETIKELLVLLPQIKEARDMHFKGVEG